MGHFQCSHLHSRLPGLPLFLRIFALSLFSPSAIGLAQTYGVQILSRTVSRRNRAVDFPQRNGWSVLFFSSGKARDERPLESKTLNKLFQYVSKNTNRFFETFHPWIRSTHIEKKTTADTLPKATVAVAEKFRGHPWLWSSEHA